MLARFGLVYADQASLLLSSCCVFDRVNQRSHLLEALLESSTALFAAVPEPKSLASTKGQFILLYTLYMGMTIGSHDYISVSVFIHSMIAYIYLSVESRMYVCMCILCWSILL